MIQFKSEEEIEIIKQSAQILGKAHGEVAKYVKEGVKTAFLDKIAEEFIRDNGGVPSFKGYNGFPSSLCISVNEVVVHGFPGQYQLKDGDIISIDCGVFHQGFHSDSAYTYPVGEVSPKVNALLKATEESLYLGIENAVFGKRVGDIGHAIQKFVEAKGYTVVRELVGHGLGRQLHEAPEVPNWGKRGSGAKLQRGMVIAIEPMVNMGTRNVVQERDGWTIRTADRRPSAHFEHTVAIFEDRTEVLTTHRYIEENFKR
ncbi:type I methionyl aminopeptidase [Cyclobacterium xiamenense]|jgi:methionyl aminopeptidase|uniref:type I methionyl aminopeptidase n=1 Tax=Cyclobacterium xiamenense TaxID=1297121 RepID=UPI0035D033EF